VDPPVDSTTAIEVKSNSSKLQTISEIPWKANPSFTLPFLYGNEVLYTEMWVSCTALVFSPYRDNPVLCNNIRLLTAVAYVISKLCSRQEYSSASIGTHNAAATLDTGSPEQTK